MECTDLRIAGLLSDYVTGHLSDDENAAIESHLERCGSCRLSLNMMDTLSDHRWEGPRGQRESHPSDEVLIRYYQDRSSLGTSTIAGIEQHLNGCEGCTAAMTLLTGLETDLRHSLSVQTTTSSFVQRVLDYARAAVRKPLAGYALVGVFALLGSAWFYQSSRSGDPVGDPASHQVYTLGEMRRSQGTVPVVRRGAGERSLHIDIPYYHIAKEREYSFQVFDLADDGMIPADIVPGFDDTGIIHLVVDAGSIPDGHYALVVLEIGTSPPVDTVSRKYPFQLKTSD